MAKFGTRITEDVKLRLLEERKKRVNETSESWYIGYLIGDNISKKIPMLSRDKYLLTISEADKLNELTDKWFDEKDETVKNKYWLDYREYDDNLVKKYLPKIYTHNEPLICIPKNMDDFNDGLRSALWDSDICEYKIEKREDVKIDIDDNFYCIKIVFQLNK